MIYLRFATRISPKVVRDFAMAGANVYQKDFIGNYALLCAVNNPNLTYLNVKQLGQLACKSIVKNEEKFCLKVHETLDNYDSTEDMRHLLQTYLQNRPDDDTQTISVLQAFSELGVNPFDFPD